MLTPADVGRDCQPKKLYPYTSTNTDVWDITKEADRDPQNPEEIRLLYTEYSIKPGGQGEEYSSNWSREHIFPQSRLNENVHRIECDAHNIFAADGSINSARNNKFFDNGGRDVVDNSPAAGYDGKTGAKTDKDSWEPPNSAKGVVSRAVFYMGVVHAQSGLKLSDDPGDSPLTMGKLSTLLQWNRDFPPGEWEKRRNDVIAKYQGNRNPFSDTHELAEQIDWLADPEPPSPPPRHPKPPPPTPRAVTPFFNEIHYDNISRDAGEAFEIALPMEMDPAEIEVILYNGSNGRPSATHSGDTFWQSQVFEDAGVRLFYRSCKLQNSMEGLALVNKITGEVYQFLSYEGEFEAKSGSAKGMRSTDIGVRETSSTKRGTSMQLSGEGRHYQDFKWESVESPCSWGFGNANQKFV